MITFPSGCERADKKTYVLASGRPWSKQLASNICVRLKQNIVLISDPAELTYKLLKEINPDFIFFPHWSYRIQRDVYEEFKCVIFHMTDVPFGRGGSPLQNLIQRGIYETKISALRCVEEMDAGPVYLKKALSLYGAAEEIFLRTAGVIEEMIVEIIEKAPMPSPQNGDPTLFLRRKPEDGILDKAQTLVQVFDMIRMLDAEGYPSAFLELGNFKFEFTRASLKSGCVISDVRISLRNESR